MTDSGTDADVTIDNGTTALILAASTIDGDLTVRSGNASGITDSGTLTSAVTVGRHHWHCNHRCE